MAVPGSRHWAAASQSRTAEQKGNPVCARFPKALLICRTEPWGKVRWWRLNSLSCKSLLTHRLSQYLVPSRVASRVYHKTKRKVVLLLGLMRPHHQPWLIRASNRRGEMQPRKSEGEPQSQACPFSSLVGSEGLRAPSWLQPPPGASTPCVYTSSFSQQFLNTPGSAQPSPVPCCPGSWGRDLCDQRTQHSQAVSHRPTYSYEGLICASSIN